MELRVSVKATGALFDGRSQAIINDQLAQAMYEATAFLERKVKQYTPQGVSGAKGGLLSTIHGEVQGKGTPIQKGIIAHGQPQYGDVIEKGRRPGSAVPKDVLLRWIEVKLGLSGSDARRAEYFIRRKIKAKGFKGAHMFEKALETGWPTVQRIFQERGFAIARELGG